MRVQITSSGPTGIRCASRSVLLALVAFIASQVARAQDLAPRAYAITPLHGNAITLSYGFYSGQFDFNEAAPVTGATGKYNVSALSYYHSFSVFGRSANVLAALPYGVGNVEAVVGGEQRHTYKSGLADAMFRVSVNLKGGPAMELQDFTKWKQKTLLGVSLRVVPPTGQYDSTKIFNWSINRWAFKPEFGYSQRWNHWVLDGYVGAWLFTTNPEFPSVPVPQPQSQRPIGSFEGHLSYDVKPFLWLSLDGNFWFGGIATLGGQPNLKTKQTASRIGGTGSLPLGKHQSVKLSYSTGAFVRYAGDYDHFSVAWQYAWIGRPK